MSPGKATTSVLVVAACLAARAPSRAQEHQHAAGERLGTVHFVTSCSPPAQATFDRALALLHSFEFGPAIDGYATAATMDASCAIAYWALRSRAGAIPLRR